MSVHAIMTLVQRLEVDLDAAAVERGVGAVDADEGREALHVGILQDDVGELLLALRHAGEGNCLRRLRDAVDDAGILDGEEAFGNDDVQANSVSDQGADGDQQRSEAVAQNELQRSAVEADDVVRRTFSDLR